MMKKLLFVLSISLLGFLQVAMAQLPVNIQFQDNPGTHNTHITSDGTYYYTINGGTTAGKINKYTLSGTFVATYSLSLDTRSIMYNSADGQLYVANFTDKGIYKITNLASGTTQAVLTNLYSNSQSSPAFSQDGSAVYVLDGGTLNKYSLANGTVLQTLTNLQCGSTYLLGSATVAIGSGYIYTWDSSTKTVYTYTLSGTLFKTTVLSSGSFGPSLSFADGKIFVSDDGNYNTGTWYGYNVAGVLPVELSSWTGNVASNGTVSLHWTTATEKNNAGFDVERSTDNVAFTKVGFVAGNGTTTQSHSYSFTDNTASGKTYYRLRQVDYDGQYTYSGVLEINAASPSTFTLEQNYPNPFNPTTTIAYTLPKAAAVSLKLYDVLGREVATLVHQNLQAGRYTATVNASRLNSGIYFYKLDADGFSQTKKLTVLK